jgi:hypothetical protein
MKAIYDKPRANLIFNGARLKAFPQRSESRQGYSLLLILFNIILEQLPEQLQTQKRKEGREGGRKFSLFADDIILYT